MTSTASWLFQPLRQNVIFWRGSSGSVDAEFKCKRAREVSLGRAFEIQDANGEANPAVFISVARRRSIVFCRDTDILVTADNHI